MDSNVVEPTKDRGFRIKESTSLAVDVMAKRYGLRKGAIVDNAIELYNFVLAGGTSAPIDLSGRLDTIELLKRGSGRAS